MLRKLNELIGYKLNARDDDLGAVKDFLFDETDWTIRHMVADTRHWLPGRLVLLHTGALDQPSWEARSFPVNLTKEQIENSPPISDAQPVSRQKEAELFSYFAWNPYWSYTGADPELVYLPPASEQVDANSDPSLRSHNELCGYKVETKDDEFGHIEDQIVDDETWIIRYLVIDTRDWLPGGKKVILPPNWFTGIRWNDQRIHVEVTNEQIESAPEFDPSVPVNREYEERLYDFYGRPAYWAEELTPKI